MPALPSFMDHEHVRSLQMALNEKTHNAMRVDGDFGPKSIAILKQFQIQNSLTPNGIYDGPTQALLEPFIQAKYLTEADYERAAQVMVMSKAIIKAAVEVEAGGDGFLPSGRCDILFERHKFHHELLQVKPNADVLQLTQRYPDIINPATGGYKGGEHEWDRLTRAMAIDKHCALLSASWGMFQIMGFNYKTCGYDSVEAFTDAMQASEGKQLDAFVKFIMADRVLYHALRMKDWKTYAAHYNGPAYAENKYDLKMAAAFNKFNVA